MLRLDGRPVDVEELASLALYNYGHFTSFVIEDMRVRGLSLHLDRLSGDCEALFSTELDTGMVREYIREGATIVGNTTVMRVTIFAPDLDMGHPVRAGSPHVLVSTRPAPTGQLPALRLQSTEYKRDDVHMKHVGLFGPIHARRLAQQSGYDDVVFTDSTGYISEGATWNIAFVSDDAVIFPRAPVLTGVTTRLLAPIIKSTKIEARVEDVAVSTVRNMRSTFITNAAVGVRGVASLNGIDLPTDESLIEQLRKGYVAIEGEVV